MNKPPPRVLKGLVLPDEVRRCLEAFERIDVEAIERATARVRARTELLRARTADLRERRKCAMSKPKTSKPKAVRFEVQAGRAIYRDGRPFFHVEKDVEYPEVTPCEMDELTHILCALLNRLGGREIVTGYLGERSVLRLRPPRKG